jgi:hypothetical protein
MFELLEPLWLLAALLAALAGILAFAFVIVAILEEAVTWVKDKSWSLRCWHDRKKKTDQR